MTISSQSMLLVVPIPASRLAPWRITAQSKDCQGCELLMLFECPSPAKCITVTLDFCQVAAINKQEVALMTLTSAVTILHNKHGLCKCSVLQQLYTGLADHNSILAGTQPCTHGRLSTLRRPPHCHTQITAESPAHIHADTP